MGAGAGVGPMRFVFYLRSCASARRSAPYPTCATTVRCNGTLPRLTTTLSAPLVAIHPRAAQLKDGGHMFYDPDIRQQALWDIQKAMEDCPRIAAETMETCVSAFCFWCERRLTFVCLLVCAASP